MLFKLMFDQLILAVIFNTAAVTSIGFVISVSSDVVVSVSDRCEALITVYTAVRLLTGMHPHMYNQVPSFIEALCAERTIEGR